MMVTMNRNSFRVMRIINSGPRHTKPIIFATCHPDRERIAGNGMCGSCYPRFVKYKIDFVQMYKNQNGNCGVCEEHIDENLMMVDHDHDTNRPRALVCRGCNRRLSVVEKSGFSKHPTFPLIIDYLTSYGKREAHYDEDLIW
jgi:hypothetical protein